MINLSSTNETTLYNVCSLPLGDIMSTVGGYHEYRVEYLEYCGGYLEYRGGSGSVPWQDIMINVGDILSTTEVFSTVVLMISPTVLMISPHGTHDIPRRYSNYKGWYPPR